MKRFVFLILIVAVGAAAYLFVKEEKPAESQPGIQELAAQLKAARKNSLTAKYISEEDLPPAGTRSLFDHLIKEHGSLPYPFEKLVELASEFDAEGGEPSSVLIPDGRSLLKGQAFFEKPRIVVAVDSTPAESDHDYGLYLKGRLHFGLVEDANEIEVIAYNEQAGRFEFQLVRDYCEGCTPRIVYAKRAICVTCHIGGGPIFSVRPWEETNGQPAIYNQILEARGVPASEADTATYHGVKIKARLAVPERYDELTDIGNVIPTTQRMWIDGCGDTPGHGTECRREMLRQAVHYLVSPGEFSLNPADYPALMQLQKVAWPANGIAQDNGNIPSRNPFSDDPAPTSFLGLARQVIFGEQERVMTRAVVVEGEKIDAFDELPPLPPELDPLTPRAPLAMYGPETLEAVFGLAQMFSDNDRRLLDLHSNYDRNRLDEALRSDVLDEALAPGPFRRMLVMDALLTALGVDPLPGSCCRDDSGMSEAMLEGVPPLEITQGSVLEVYEKYCFGCHRGNPSARLNFMGGETEQEVLERIKVTDGIADALDYERYLGTAKEGTLMPPGDSHQRELLDQARAEGSEDLQRMVDTIPSMFDF